MRTLSKSTYIMFLSDLIIFCFSTIFWCYYFLLKLKILIPAVCLIVVTGLITLYLKENYKIREFNITAGNIYRLFEGVIFAHVPMYIILSFFFQPSLLLKFAGINILSVFVLLFLYRFCFHYWLFYLKKVKNILIIGTDTRAKIISDEIKNKFALRMKVVGLVDVDIPTENLSEKGGVLRSIIEKNNVDIIIISQQSLLSVFIPKNITIYKMPEFYEMLTGKYYIDEKTITDFHYQFSTRQTFIYDFFKRIFDIISALIILIVTFPITAYIAVRIKLTDGASPFFSQTRIGKNGKKFECYKLRTMYVNDFIPKNAQMLNDGSERVIPFCKLIRKAKLDEVPQMVNIIKGEMSVVGPRAEWEKFANVFKKEIPFYSLRNLVKAGWTGWAHINMQAAYSTDEEKERLAYDLYYIKHQNILWDFAILIKAVFLACGGRHK